MQPDGYQTLLDLTSCLTTHFIATNRNAKPSPLSFFAAPPTAIQTMQTDAYSCAELGQEIATQLIKYDQEDTVKRQVLVGALRYLQHVCQSGTHTWAWWQIITGEQSTDCFAKLVGDYIQTHASDVDKTTAIEQFHGFARWVEKKRKDDVALDRLYVKFPSGIMFTLQAMMQNLAQPPAASWSCAYPFSN